MFSKVATFALVSSLISGVLATPMFAAVAPSFNDYQGISSLSGFDNFNGQNNFDGSNNAQIIVIQEQERVCRTVKIEIIQQKLVILREMAKRYFSPFSIECVTNFASLIVS